jgi:hypothetical protein
MYRVTITGLLLAATLTASSPSQSMELHISAQSGGLSPQPLVIPTAYFPNSNAGENPSHMAGAERFDYERLLNGDPGKAHSTVTIAKAEPVNPLASADLVMHGIVVAATAHLSGNNQGVYTTYIVSVERIFRSSDAALLGKLVQFEMPGGNVIYPSGDEETVQPEGLGFPQLGHSYVLVGRSVGSNSWQLLQSFLSVRGQIMSTSAAFGGPHDTEQVRQLASAYPAAISSLIATEDYYQPIVDLKTPTTVEVTNPLRKFRYHAGLSSADVSSATPHLPTWTISGNVEAYPVDRSNAIVLATVTSMATDLAPDMGGVYSTFELKINSVLSKASSELPPATSSLTVEMAGGRVLTRGGVVRVFGNFGQTLLEPGAQYILFLNLTQNHDAWVVQGSYRILNGKVFSGNRHSPDALSLDDAPLDQFEQNLRAVLAGKLDGLGRAQRDRVRDFGFVISF